MLSITCATECVLAVKVCAPVHVGVSADTNTLGTLFVVIWRVKFFSFAAVRISLCSSSWSHVFSNAWNSNEGAGSFPWSAAGHLWAGLFGSPCFDRGKYSCCCSPLHQLGSAVPPPAQPALVAGCFFLLPHPMGRFSCSPLTIVLSWGKGWRSWSEKACKWVWLPHPNHLNLSL